jgi:hypothetical protein
VILPALADGYPARQNPARQKVWALSADIDPQFDIVYYFHTDGDGVPQNRLMRADDSCRVENAGVGRLRYVRSGALAVSPRSGIVASRASRDGAPTGGRIASVPAEGLSRVT